MIASVSDILPLVLPHVPGCRDDFANMAVRTAIREFLARSEVWQKTLTAISLVASTQAYDLNPDTSAGAEPEIRRVVWAQRTTATSSTGPVIDHRIYTLVGKVASPYYQFRFHDDHIPTASVTSGLTVKVVLVPQENTDTVPDFELTRWVDGIAAKAAAYLKQMPGRRWTDLAGVAIQEDKFRREVASAVKTRIVGHKNVSLTMQGGRWI